MMKKIILKCLRSGKSIKKRFSKKKKPISHSELSQKFGIELGIVETKIEEVS